MQHKFILKNHKSILKLKILIEHNIILIYSFYVYFFLQTYYECMK